jgi:hypothetical protein
LPAQGMACSETMFLTLKDDRQTDWVIRFTRIKS